MSTPQFTIPKTQRAAVVPSFGAPVELRTDVPVTQPADLAPGECLVKITYSGVCHTDLHAAKNDWPVPAKSPLIGGHEGLGVVVAIAENTPFSPVKLGDRVGIKWLADSCLQCESCRKGWEQNCSKAKVSGFTVDGTFAEYVVSYVNHVTPIPDSINDAEAASILCAGVTTYRAIKHSNTHAGDWIVIPGAGGGLGHLAVQYAVYMGLRVVAIDTGEDKKALCKSLGAEVWLDFKTSQNLVQDIITACDGLGPHATLITAAHSSAYTDAVSYLRPAGTLVMVGLPNAPLGVNIWWAVFKSIRIVGSYVGNRQDAVEAMGIAARGGVRVVYQMKGLGELREVYEGMEKGTIAGRMVLDMSK